MMHSTICHRMICKGKKPALLLVWLFLWQLASDWLGQELLLVSPVVLYVRFFVGTAGGRFAGHFGMEGAVSACVFIGAA